LTWKFIESFIQNPKIKYPFKFFFRQIDLIFKFKHNSKTAPYNTNKRIAMLAVRKIRDEDTKLSGANPLNFLIP
jgi:hypothetical protein